MTRWSGRVRASVGTWVPVLVLLGGLMCVAHLAQAQTQGNTGLVGGASGDHLWFVGPDLWSPEKTRLYHHATGMNGPFFRSPRWLPRLPESIAVSGAQAWLVFPEGGERREVYTIRARTSEVEGLYRYLPIEGLELVSPLPADGQLLALVAGNDGPLALIVPTHWGGGRVAPLAEPMLLSLRDGRWIELGLPALESSQLLVGLIQPRGGGPIMLFARSAEHVRKTLIYTLQEDGSWTSIEIDLNPRSLVHVFQAGERIVLTILTEGEGRRSGRRDLFFLRQGKLVEFGQVPADTQGAVLTGMDNGAVLVEYTQGDSPEFQLRRASHLTHKFEEPVLLEGQQLAGLAQWIMPVASTLVLLVLIGALLMKPGGSGKVSLPGGLVPGDIGQRGLALVLDLVPSGLIVLLVTGAHPSSLLRSTYWASDIETLIPIALVAAITAAHCAVGEAMMGRSLGKRIVGLRVVRLDGSRVRFPQVLLRNLFKILVILFPAIGILVLMNPSRQGPGDLLARTVVVAELTRSEGQPQS